MQHSVYYWLDYMYFPIISTYFCRCIFFDWIFQFSFKSSCTVIFVFETEQFLILMKSNVRNSDMTNQSQVTTFPDADSESTTNLVHYIGYCILITTIPSSSSSLLYQIIRNLEFWFSLTDVVLSRTGPIHKFLFITCLYPSQV